MALRRSAQPEAAAPPAALVPVREVGIAARPGYGFDGLPSLTEELVGMARALELEVIYDTIERPCLSATDAGRLYHELTQPAAPVVEAPRPRQVKDDMALSPEAQRRAWAAGRSVGSEVG